MANSRNSRPTTSAMNSSGISTAISDTVSETSVKPISSAPFSAAWNGVSPISMWRAMFSTMTMASSTTKPVAMVSAISVRLLIEKPARYITPKVPTSDSGTTMLGMIVAGTLRRNRNVTSTTSADGEDQLVLHVLDRGADGLGAVAQHGHFEGRRQAGGELRQQLLDAVDDLDDVGAGLALDVDQHRRQLVGPGQQAAVLGAVDDVGDVLQADRRAVAVGDDQFLVGLGRAQLIVGVEGERPLRPVEAALGLVDVGGGDDRADALQVEAVRGQRLRVGLDAHGRPLAAGDADQADAGQLRQLLRHARIDQVVDLRQRHGAGGHRQRQHRRVGRVDLVVDRRLRQVVRQQAVGGVHRRLHFLLGDAERLGRARSAA